MLKFYFLFTVFKSETLFKRFKFSSIYMGLYIKFNVFLFESLCKVEVIGTKLWANRVLRKL